MAQVKESDMHPLKILLNITEVFKLAECSRLKTISFVSVFYIFFSKSSHGCNFQSVFLSTFVQFPSHGFSVAKFKI